MQACISDDLSSCPPVGNVLLRFQYPNFTNKINLVNIGIYNEKGRLIKLDTLKKAELNELQGYKTQLPDGKYSAVVWANAVNYTEIEGFEALSRLNTPDNIVINKQFIERQELKDNDSLYLGRTNFRVDSIADTVIQLNPSFITLNIQVKGYHFINTQTNNQQDISLVVRNAPVSLDINNTTGPIKANFHPDLTLNATQHIGYSSLRIFRFTNMNTITIDVLNNKKQVVYSVDLQSLLTSNHINLKTNQELIIPVNIEFFSLSAATVTLGAWSGTKLSPVI